MGTELTISTCVAVMIIVSSRAVGTRTITGRILARATIDTGCIRILIVVVGASKAIALLNGPARKWVAVCSRVVIAVWVVVVDTVATFMIATLTVPADQALVALCVL